MYDSDYSLSRIYEEFSKFDISGKKIARGIELRRELEHFIENLNNVGNDFPPLQETTF